MPATLHAVRLSAQREADRLNKPMAILNLNRFGPLYVVRDWNDNFTSSAELVEKINPTPREIDDGMGGRYRPGVILSV